MVSSLIAALMVPSLAISPKRVESVKSRAATDNKLIAFVVEQDFYNPNCPKCITQVTANNNKINRLVPHKGVIVVKLQKPDLKEGEVPDIVLKAGGLPRIVITDAACEKVVDAIDVNADKKRVKEMEGKIAALVGIGS